MLTVLSKGLRRFANTLSLMYTNWSQRDIEKNNFKGFAMFISKDDGFPKPKTHFAVKNAGKIPVSTCGFPDLVSSKWTEKSSSQGMARRM